MSRQPVLLICMGVSGSGKSTVAQSLAKAFSLKSYEADDFHSAENRLLMAAGTGLTDAQREPWLDSICTALGVERQAGNDCVLAYSGLRRAHRQRFRELGFRVHFFYLNGADSIISTRMQSRQGHFMPAAMLQSQIRDMQAPVAEADVVCVDINHSLVATLELTRNLAGEILQRT